MTSRLESVDHSHHILSANGTLVELFATLSARDIVTALQQNAIDPLLHTNLT